MSKPHVNLHIDPKEQYPIGHGMDVFLASMAAQMNGHAGTFKKLPTRNARAVARSSPA
ncbi:hypothetical protein [Ensifer sp. 4252]|uniref:hypothetical protein n=1 Tax=Ensifer sp. 4252 TaxID=3373915 RepID=UPI003D190912